MSCWVWSGIDVALRVKDVVSEVRVLSGRALETVLCGRGALAGGRAAAGVRVVIHDVFVLFVSGRTVENR